MWPKLQEIADLVTFTEETPNGKLHFFACRVEGCLIRIMSERRLVDGVSSDALRKRLVVVNIKNKLKQNYSPLKYI